MIFIPNIIVSFNDNSDKEYYKRCLRDLFISFEKLSEKELQHKSFIFYDYLLQTSTIEKEKLYLNIENVILDYFHSRNLLLFKDKVIVVQKTHQNRYEFICETPHGILKHKFSSIREFRESSGLKLEKQLRKILY